MADALSRTLPHVVVVGGGFAGLQAARALSRAPVRVTVVDRRNHHLFQPLLYQVATAALSPADIAAPIRHILRRQSNAEVRLGDVIDVDVESRELVLASGESLPYDFLVVAAGAVDHYFGNDGWASYAPGLKRLEDAIEIRRRFLLAFEAAEHASDPEERAALLTFVVVGGGPTGVEMAGAFAEIARHTLAGGDFRRVDPSRARILLMEGGPRILSTYPEDLGRDARHRLEKLGVEVREETLVSRVGPASVMAGDDVIRTRNVVWAAGVAGSPLGARLGVETDRAGRVPVEPDLSVPGRPEIFVVGDLASFSHQTRDPLPAIAPVAIQQGKAAGANVARAVAGRPRVPFHYRDRGSLATIGRGAAVGEIAGLGVKGLVAWIIWLFVHLMYLVGFRNRVAVLLEWAWAYLTWQRGARLITGDIGPDLGPVEAGGAEGWMEGDAEQGSE